MRYNRSFPAAEYPSAQRRAGMPGTGSTPPRRWRPGLSRAPRRWLPGRFLARGAARRCLRPAGSARAKIADASGCEAAQTRRKRLFCVQEG